jgi:hypothetical protein
VLDARKKRKAKRPILARWKQVTDATLASVSLPPRPCRFAAATVNFTRGELGTVFRKVPICTLAIRRNSPIE